MPQASGSQAGISRSYTLNRGLESDITASW
jgi:hypothetical protein